MITKIAFVAHPTRNMEAGRRFWGELLGLSLTNDYANMWVEYDTPDGKSIALDTFSPEQMLHPAPYLALESDDVEGEVERLRQAGVQVLKDVWQNDDEQGRAVCKMAIIADPDGQAVMLHQMAAWRQEGEG